jgi:hypothetical protein
MTVLGACRLIAGAAIAVTLASGPALAQSSQGTGTTSGAAAGNNVQPSTANDKKSGGDNTTGSTAAGAPGTAAKKGSESGPAPDQKPHH